MREKPKQGKETLGHQIDVCYGSHTNSLVTDKPSQAALKGLKQQIKCVFKVHKLTTYHATAGVARMSWIVRIGCVCLLATFLSGCPSLGDVGKPCKLTQDQNVKNLKELDTKARIVEASANCDLLSYCFANFYVAENDTQPNNTLGYCSNFCTPDQNQCPKGFTCAPFINVQTLPASHKETLAPLVNQSVCIKEPPSAEQ